MTNSVRTRSGFAMRLCVAGLMVFSLTVVASVMKAQRADAAGECIGYKGSTARRIVWTSDGVLHLAGCAQEFTPAQLVAALGTALVTGTPPADAVQSLGSNQYLFNVNVQVEEGATLRIKGATAGGTTDWLKLKSNPGAANFVKLRAENGQILIGNSKVTSWDTIAQAPDTDDVDGRAFVAARTTWDGRATVAPTPCSVNGGSQEPSEARMDVINSEMSSLGFYDGESYGVVWKVYSKIPPPNRGLYDLTDVFGTVTNSTFDHNYFGVYTYGAYCMNFKGNTFQNNKKYGLDPHDDSDSLTIENNLFRNNGDHGVICSMFCSDIVIRNNESYGNNGHGIMIHRQVNNALIEGNNSHDNLNTGIAVFDSFNGVIRDNTLTANFNAGIRYSVATSDILAENNTIVGAPASTGGTGNAVLSFVGSDAPTFPGDGRLSTNMFRNNTMSTPQSVVIDEDGGDNWTFEGNKFVGSQAAIVINGGAGNTVASNDPTSTMTPSIQTITAPNLPGNTFVKDQVINKAISLVSAAGGTNTVADTRNYIWQRSDGGTNTAKSTGTTFATTANITVTPRFLAVDPTSADVTTKITSWATSGNFAKAWTEIGTGTSGAIAHQVGSMVPSTCYAVSVNALELLKQVSTASGVIQFSYAGIGSGETKNFTVASASSCGAQPAPDTAIVNKPAALTNATSASFTYTSSLSNATFECRIDAAAFGSCPVVGQSYSGLADGSHTFDVRAIVSGQSDATPATYTWMIDNQAPVVSASPAPGNYTAPQSVALSSNESAVIRYTTDGTTPTGSSTQYTAPIAVNVSTTIKFFAVDTANNSSVVTTAAYVINVASANPPQTTIVTGPSGTVSSTTAAFTYSSDDAAATFECSLDNAVFTSCPASGISYSALANGAHTFAVQATNVNGTDLTPATRTWTVDTSVPASTFSEDFETGNLSKWSYQGGMVVANGANAYDGTFGGRASSTGLAVSYLRKDFTPVNDLNAQMRVKITSLNGTSATLVRFRDASNNSIVQVKVDSSRRLQYQIGSGSTVTTSYTLTLGQWVDLQVRGQVNGATGHLTIAVNGAAITDVNANLGTANFGRFQIGDSSSGRKYDVSFDNVNLLDTTVQDTQAPVVTASPIGGSYSSAQSVILSANEPATIRFTTDGQTPTGLSPAYSSPIAVSADATIKFFATDTAGNSSAVSGEVYTIVVAPIVPDTNITSGPTGTVATASASLSFTSTDAVATFECSLDNAAFSSCSSPAAYTALADGAHTFAVRSTNSVGTDPSPATRTWTVNTLVAPTLFSDDFETGNVSNWSYNTGFTVQAGAANAFAGTFGGRSMSTGSSISYVRKDIAATNDLTSSMRVKLTSLNGTAVTLARFRDASNNSLVNIQLDSSRRLQYQIGSATAVTTAYTVVPGVWLDVQVHVQVNGASSHLTIVVDGATITDAVVNIGTVPVSRFQIGDSSSGRKYEVAYDNITLS